MCVRGTGVEGQYFIVCVSRFGRERERERERERMIALRDELLTERQRRSIMVIADAAAAAPAGSVRQLLYTVYTLAFCHLITRGRQAGGQSNFR